MELVSESCMIFFSLLVVNKVLVCHKTDCILKSIKYGIFPIFIITKYEETSENLYFKEISLAKKSIIAFHCKIFKLSLLYVISFCLVKMRTVVGF